LTTDDEPYDILLETILTKSKCIEDAYSIIYKAFENGKAYQWCNIVIATLDIIAAFEVGPKIFTTEEHEVQMVRTNHHILLSTKESLSVITQDKIESGNRIPLSEKRRKQANELISDVSKFEDVIKLLSTHSKTKGYDSICRHRLSGEKYVGETTYAYIFEVIKYSESDLYFQIHVARSNPCINPFEKIIIDFDLSKDEKKDVVQNFP
jgi:hypothetical protein